MWFCRFLVFARHGHNLMGASPGRALIAGITQSKTRVVHREVESLKFFFKVDSQISIQRLAKAAPAL